eukprot:CAMPEP_0196767956 /NCGR_PEP_ID=MMETSP1095-20130614/42164_1 /TAXON_ID=96789 ORGANISM="Chromulina nebulosa, Strain UTEXLB2642" /NCGR_SAMPLE_ID=MMETSP1095 /ASSEMBLY_ACC=CAM_ASM_000446 /LENGTH=251 /DNA_ID=CAMNT_0042136855 /DNA_START=336 /DNA_END=1091 /DNA_ORIENTATION=-
MGASGSGKTTLLSTLSLRLDTRHMEVDGKIRLNGREYTKTILKSMSAYVMQDDILHVNKAVELTTVDLDIQNGDLPSVQSIDYIKIDLNNDITEADESLDRMRSHTFSAYVPDNAPTVLTFENITVRTKAEPVVTLLHSISGQISGGFYAIMGASGSGKTTLLSTLSLRLDTRHMEVDGKIRLNGREYTKTILKSMSAYVMQDDILHAELTVSETLSFAAELRLPPTITREERINRVEEVSLMMGIGHLVT